MADITYRIVTELGSSGSLTNLTSAEGKLDSMDKSIQKIGSGLKGVATSISDTFNGVVEKVASIGFSLAKIGVGVGIGLATYGVAQLNNELEQTKMSLSAIFTANGAAGSMKEGMEEAARVVENLRKSSAALPIDFKEAAMVMKTIASSGFQTGASINDLQQLALKTATFANIENISGRVAAREMATLLAGHATSQNVIALRLGLNGKELKSMSPEERRGLLEKDLDAYVGKATSTFATSYRALFTTLKNDIEYGFLQPATQPLFEKIKQGMAAAHKWFEDNQSTVSSWAQYFGSHLAAAWDRGLSLAKEWWPIILNFAESTAFKIEDLWKRLEPTIKTIADYIKGMLSDTNKVFSGIGGIATAYGASKIGGSALKAASSLGPEGGVAGGIIIGSLVAEFLAMEHAIKVNDNAAVHFKDALDKLQSGWGKLSEAFSDDHVFGQLITKYGEFVATMLDFWSTVFDYIGGAIKAIDHLVDQPWFKKYVIGEDFNQLTNNDEELNQAMMDYATTHRPEHDLSHMWGPAQTNDDLSDKLAKKMNVTGGGGTKIGKIEIFVQQTGDPARVARAVADKLADIQRYKRSSPWVPNFSGSR